MSQKRRVHWGWWVTTGLLTVVVLSGAAVYAGNSLRSANAAAHQESGSGDGRQATQQVAVVRPEKGGLLRTTEQPGTVQAFEMVSLRPAVSGYLKEVNVDIGDKVSRGKVLARIDVPDLEKQAKRCAAGLEQAKAKVKVAQARVVTANADWDVAKTAITKAEAAAKSAKAMRTFRELQLRRMEDLYASRSIEERLVDEKKEQAEAAVEAERASRAAILATQAQEKAEEAKVHQAEADVLDAQAAVQVAEADLEKAQVMLQFAAIVSPFDGVITQRNFFPGDYVRGATEGQMLPLFTIERTDKMRMVVQVPDRDVPYADAEDAAVVEVDALPNEQFKAKVSRISSTEDPQTRLMRVEIDLPNPAGKLRQGMYGRVKIFLESAPDALSVPSSCLAGKITAGKGTVWVVKGGKLEQRPVRVGFDNGLRVAILDGLSTEDQVVLQPTASLASGRSVEPVEYRAADKKGH